MPAQDVHLSAIRNSVLFRDVPLRMVNDILKKTNTRSLDRGETLFVQGDPALQMYVVLEGLVKLTRITPTGDEVIVAVYARGESFGEAAALKGGVFPVTVEAASDSIVLVIKAATLFEKIQKAPELAMAMLSCTFSHLHELVIEIESMKARSGLQRLAVFLTTLAPVDKGSCTISLPYDKVLLAGRLGMKPESLSRSFSNLRSYGVIVSRDQVAISDVERLQDLVKLEKPARKNIHQN